MIVLRADDVGTLDREPALRSSSTRRSTVRVTSLAAVEDFSPSSPPLPSRAGGVVLFRLLLGSGLTRVNGAERTEGPAAAVRLHPLSATFSGRLGATVATELEWPVTSPHTSDAIAAGARA